MRSRSSLALLAALVLGAPFALAAAPAPTAAEDNEVVVLSAGFSYAPAALVIPAGTTVRWDGALLPHTVTTAAGPAEAVQGVPNDRANSDGNPDTFNRFFAQGASFSHTFENPGTFSYFCELHVRFGMVGEIVVV